ncbi:MAG: Mur ligase family protein, partial [Pseudomonadota bacterium]
MRIDESRRLTGPNLFSDLPGAICDVEVEPEAQSRLIEVWREEVTRFLEAVGWADSQLFTRQHATGVSLVMSAPIDCLYAATDVNEAAFEAARDRIEEKTPRELERVVERLKGLIDKERNPALVALASDAANRHVPFLSDDDDVSLGYGANARLWRSDRVPETSELDWESYGSFGDIPVALVTGTNGKSTTVRLAASIIAASGRTCGVTSTDYIRVGDEVIDTGDYSGPGGARQLLRHKDTEVALLEVARGGMLRRGLGVTHADAALITNVAADHLGEYGIHTVPELRDAKFIVRRGLASDHPLILNADDEGVVQYAKALEDYRIIWFSEDAGNPIVVDHFAGGGVAFVVAGNILCRLDDGVQHDVVHVESIPVTLGGSARHNVQNALAAAALGYALGCADNAIRDGLIQFKGGQDDNPGRGNFYEGNGVRAVVDFAHNEHGLRAMASTIAAIPAERRLVLMGQAGDRSDELIRGLTLAALEANPDHLVICQLPGYERGREPDAVQKLIQQVAIEAGVPESAMTLADSPIDGTRFALDWAEEGDLLLILALTQRGPCTRMVERALT